ncbi:ABC transporter substrate-binding protein [Kitasatospora sp. NPDC051853]|uniref:ABC transporter substrate-binding protein n=1 Tax=Kitasatospora sp. NPDC051853 TaxID=3364058 RepID=UPI003794F417
MPSLPRRLTALALASACALTAASCTATPAPRSQGRTTVTFWTMPFWIGHPEELHKLVSDFNVSQGKVTVELTVLDWQSGRDRIKQAVLAGTGPDVWLSNNGLEDDYLNGRHLAPLDELGYTTEDLARFLPMAKVNEHEGRLYGAPLYFDAAVLFYRTDILRKYGHPAPPTTWAELKSTATAITTRSAASGKRISGWQFKGMDDHLNAVNATWSTFLCQAGGSLTSPDFRTSTQNTEAGRTAMNYMKSFYADRTSQEGLSALKGFVDGEVAMFSFYQSAISDIVAGNEKTLGRWAVAPMPTGPRSGCSAVGGHSLVARSGLPDPGAAGSFMRWLASPRHSTRFMEFHGIYPYDTSRTDPETKVVVDSFYRTDPTWAAVSEQFARNTPDLLLQDRHAFAVRWESHKSAVPDGVAGRTGVDQALALIDERVDRKLRPAG